MPKEKLKHIAIGLAAFALSCANAKAATTITVAVTPTAAPAIVDLVADFVNANPTYDVAVVGSSDSLSKDAIVAGGATGPYDLLLAQSYLVPANLKYHYPSLVSGDLFPYAKDTLVLYSTTVDISQGVPLQMQAFSVPDPATLDPYGVAAVQAMRAEYLYALAKRLPIKTVDAGGSYAQVAYLGTAYGFTGKSQICTAVTSVEQYEPGSFHHEYVLGQNYMTDIVLAGVKIARTRTADQETALTAFVNFLTSAKATALQHHCYKLPSAAQ
jgi:molybdate transport system substrate-binding protein